MTDLPVEAVSLGNVQVESKTFIGVSANNHKFLLASTCLSSKSRWVCLTDDAVWSEEAFGNSTKDALKGWLAKDPQKVFEFNSVKDALWFIVGDKE